MYKLKILLLLLLIISSCGIKIPIFKRTYPTDKIQYWNGNSKIHIEPHTLDSTQVGITIKGLQLGLQLYFPDRTSNLHHFSTEEILIDVQANATIYRGVAKISLDSVPKYIPVIVPINFQNQTINLKPKNVSVTIHPFNFTYNNSQLSYPKQMFKLYY